MNISTIYNGIFSFYSEISEMWRFREIVEYEETAKHSFCDIINQYTAFISGKNDFLTNYIKPETDKKVKESLPDEIIYILYLVENFYKIKMPDEANKMFANNKTEIKNCLLNSSNDGINFFDMVNAKCWIDILSALDYHLGIFSSKENSRDFDSFLKNFKNMYSKLNNRTYPVFYVPWLSEICAAYTIYLNGTRNQFTQMLDSLKNTLKLEQLNNTLGVSDFDSKDIKSMTNEIISILKLENKEEVVNKLQEYIKVHPDNFIYEVGKIRGNINLWSVLEANDAFKKALDEYIPNKNTGRGKPAKQLSNQINYIIDSIEILYNETGKKFDSKSYKSSLKTCLENAENGAFFFDSNKATIWIDVLSALNYRLHIFSLSGKDDFNEFFKEYVYIYSKLNNSKTVSFYARNLSEIAAMYTIYIKETSDYYKELKKELETVLESGRIEALSKGNFSFGKTSTIAGELLFKFSQGYNLGKSNKDKEEYKKKVIIDLKKYVHDNPFCFVDAVSDQNIPYRRFYCAICNMMSWIKENKPENFLNSEEELFDIFNNNVKYDHNKTRFLYKKRDKYIYALANCLAKELRSFTLDDNEIYEYNPDMFLECLEQNEIKLMEIYKGYRGYNLIETLVKRVHGNRETFSLHEDSEGNFYRELTLEEVIDYVVKILRFIVGLIKIYKASSSPSKFDTWSYNDLIRDINGIYIEFGLLQLPNCSNDYNNEASVLDLCMVRYIENQFPEY